MSLIISEPDDAQPAHPEIPEYLTSAQLIEFYNISGPAVRRCRGNGPPYVKLGDARGSRVLYSRVEVERWLRARQFANTSEHSAAQAIAEAGAA